MALGALNTHPLNRIPLNGALEQIPVAFDLPESTEVYCVPPEFRTIVVAPTDNEIWPFCEDRIFVIHAAEDVITVPPRSGSC